MARGLALLTCGVGLALFAPAFTPSLPRSGLSAMPKAGPRRESLTQRAADGSGLKPFGPVVAYAKASMVLVARHTKALTKLGRLCILVFSYCKLYLGPMVF